MSMRVHAKVVDFSRTYATPNFCNPLVRNIGEASAGSTTCAKLKVPVHAVLNM